MQPETFLIIGISFHILLLFTFKYLAFLSKELGLWIHKDFSKIKISLPIGIYFFTFQLMSYLFDIYYKKSQTQKSVLYVGLYVSLFPQLIADPIVRYSQIEDEIVNRIERKEDILQGMEQFIWGLGKKVLISNYLAQIVDNIFTVYPFFLLLFEKTTGFVKKLKGFSHIYAFCSYFCMGSFPL